MSEPEQRELNLHPEWDMTAGLVWRCRSCGHCDYADGFDVLGAEVGAWCPECGEDTETASWDGEQWLPPLTPEEEAAVDAMMAKAKKSPRRRGKSVG